MEVTHHTRSVRISPRKLRLVADKIRHLKADYALEMLPLITNKGSLHLEKSLKAAIGAAIDQDMDKDTLVIQRLWCDEGRSLKRTIGHSRGQSRGIMKKYSHINIVLKGETAGKPKVKKNAAVAEETIASEEK